MQQKRLLSHLRSGLNRSFQSRNKQVQVLRHTNTLTIEQNQCPRTAGESCPVSYIRIRQIHPHEKADQPLPRTSRFVVRGGAGLATGGVEVVITLAPNIPLGAAIRIRGEAVHHMSAIWIWRQALVG